MAAASNALTYNLYVSQVANLAVMQTQTVSGVVEGVDASFNALIPSMLNYAELRIQRDLDLLPSLTSRTYSLAADTNTLQISVDDFVTIQTIQVAHGSTVVPTRPVSKELLQNVYPTDAVKGPPVWFAMTGGDATTGGSTYNNITFGPFTDAIYSVTAYGTIRLPSLYKFANPTDAGTGTTFISTYLPDLLIQASMIYVSEFQRNFTPTGNDPEMPGSYELQYGALLKSAVVEEARKKFQASAWSSMAPPIVATPNR